MIPPAIEQLLQHACSVGATDITLTDRAPIRLRVRGTFQKVEPLPAADYAAFVRALAESQGQATVEPLSTGCFVDAQRRRFRFVAYRSEQGFTLEIRKLAEKIPSYESLGLPPEFGRLIRARRGIIIVTGRTGSGKSTTLAAVLSHLLATPPAVKLLTLEDPIEYLHGEDASVVRQTQLLRDFPDYPKGISALLRQDTDVALIGELRDSDAMSAAMTAAETGHLIFTTLHTRDAAGAVGRILDGCASSDTLALLSGSLVCVLAQELVPTREGGVTPVYELLVNTVAVRNCIRNRRIDHVRNEVLNGAGGMVSMDASLLQLYRRKKIDRATALQFAHAPETLDKQLT